MQTQIVYEDEAVLVIRKPAGLATESAGIGQKDVVSELKNYVAKKNPGKMPYLGIVHRLDQPVEGLLVFAKTKKAAENLTAQLGKGMLKKEYLAVVCGKVPENTGRLVDYLAKEKGMAVVKNAADAKTEKDVDAQAEKAADPQAKRRFLLTRKSGNRKVYIACGTDRNRAFSSDKGAAFPCGLSHSGR